MSPLILFVILFNLIVNIDSVNGLDMFGDPSSSSSALHEKNQEKNTEKIEISSSYGDICKDYIHYYCDCDYLIPGQARHVQCSIFNITGLESNSDEWNHFWTQPNIESLTMDCRDRSSDGLSYVPSVALAYIFNTIKFISLIYFKIDTIKSYTFTNIPLLETIILDENRIETMEEYSFNNLPNVTKISLIRNGIKSIKKGTFVHLPKLKELDVSSCNIDTIDEESFHNISSLTILSLKNNNISSLSPEIFQNLNNLEDLDLAYNSITFLVDNLFSDCSSLKYLDLQSNSIIQLERNTFQGLVSLVTLNLSRNKLKYIGDVSLFSSPSLSYVTIGENHLEKLDPRFIDSIHNKDQLHFLIDFKGRTFFLSFSFLFFSILFLSISLSLFSIFIFLFIFFRSLWFSSDYFFISIQSLPPYGFCIDFFQYFFRFSFP